MRRGPLYLSSFPILAAALAGPTATGSAAGLQDSGRAEQHREEKGSNRVYDRAHQDYHNWDDNEGRFYRQYYEEKGREYRPWAETNQRDQRAYWNWRHGHLERGQEARRPAG
jgi:hypothetical protein